MPKGGGTDAILCQQGETRQLLRWLGGQGCRLHRFELAMSYSVYLHISSLSLSPFLRIAPTRQLEATLGALTIYLGGGTRVSIVLGMEDVNASRTPDALGMQ